MAYGKENALGSRSVLQESNGRDKALDTRAILIRASLDLEKRIQDLYLKASGLSKSLPADVSRAMVRVAKSRDDRISKLRALIEAMGN